MSLNDKGSWFPIMVWNNKNCNVKIYYYDIMPMPSIILTTIDMNDRYAPNVKIKDNEFMCYMFSEDKWSYL